MPYDDWRARMGGNAFDDGDVARAYDFRPPYAPAMFDFLAGLVSRKNVLVDLGCGPGKVAAALADRFERVVAVDASGPMIERARELHAERHLNIAWQHAPAEDATLPERIDLVTAGTSIHWMKHGVLFPILAERTSLVAVIAGDAPSAATWQAEENALLTAWLARIGIRFDPAAFAAKGRSFETWMNIAGEKEFRFEFQQSVADYIACQHSRATFSRARMGDDLAAAFDAEYGAALAPFARNGILRVSLTTSLTWGMPRTIEKQL